MSRWPDIEIALVAYLRGKLGVQVGTLIPGKVETLPAFVRVTRGPGSDDLITDSPLIDVETFAPLYKDSYSLAEDVRQALHDLSGKRSGPALVDRVRTSVTPSWVDYHNPGTNRFVASYRIEFRQESTNA